MSQGRKKTGRGKKRGNQGHDKDDDDESVFAEYLPKVEEKVDIKPPPRDEDAAPPNMAEFLPRDAIIRREQASNTQLIRYAVISWAIPFFAGFAFFAPDPISGQYAMAIDKGVFKNVMIMLCAPLFGTLLNWSVRWHDISSVIRTALCFATINIALDVVVLVPMSRMSLLDYFMEIGAVYPILICSQCWFGYSLATVARPASNSYIGIALRAPLASLTSYVATSFMYDEKQSNPVVSVAAFRTVMVLATSFSVGLNLLKALEQVRDLRKLALPATAAFLGVSMIVDVAIFCPAFKWSLGTYFYEKGFRLISCLVYAIIARGVGAQQ